MYKCETRSITKWLAIKNGEWFREQDFTAVKISEQNHFMTRSAVHQQCDAAECLEMILNKVSPHVSEVSTCCNQVSSRRTFLVRVTLKYISDWSDWCNKVFRGELMYTTRCDKGCVINNETTPFWSIPLSLRDKNMAAVDVVGDRKSTYFISQWQVINMWFLLLLQGE